MDQPKISLVIGGSGGLGESIARNLMRCGNHVAVHSYSNSERSQRLVKEMQANQDVQVISVEADIRSQTSVEAMIADVEQQLGKVDILINAAGISIDGMSWKMSPADWQTVLDTNLTGPFLCSRAVLPSMRSNRWGRIVNLSSIVGQTGVPGTSAYAASKSGLFGMTRSMASEVASKGITVNALSLGYFDTGLIESIGEVQKVKIRENIPSGRFGRAEEVAGVIEYLVSDVAGYVNGQIVNLNGGLHMN
jgi:3-oxoacyl-[acyl-carrier protein] reductase